MTERVARRTTPLRFWTSLAVTVVIGAATVQAAQGQTSPPAASSASEKISFEQTLELENARFEHQLVTSVVEKLGIGAFVLVLGFYLNRAVERYKSRAAFLSGYTTKHIEAISDVWQLIYRWESAVRGYARRYASIDPEERHDLVDDLMPAIDDSRRRSAAVRSYVDENRFWLGEELYSRFVRYHNSLDPYLDAMLMGKANERIGLEMAMYENKQDILSLLQVTPERLFT